MFKETILAPILGFISTSLQPSRRRIASRNGPRLMPYCLLSCGSLILEPGSSSPSIMAVRIRSKTPSASVDGLVPRENSALAFKLIYCQQKCN